MAFSLDRTRCFIRIDEPNLISIHRSTSPIVPTLDCSQGHLFDAFICAAREYNLFRVYIGLYDSKLKSNLVFVTDPVGFDDKKTSFLIKEAEAFLTNIGFSMERVNMEFSTATREVIMRDIKVLREPSHAVRLDAAMLAIEGLTQEKNELIQKASRTHKAFKAEVDKLRRQLTLANTATVEAAERTATDEESVDALIMERDSLRAELAGIREEIEKIRSEHAHAHVNKKKSQHDQQAVDVLVEAAKEETRVLREDLCVAMEKAEAARHEFDKVRQEVLVLKDAVKDAREAARSAEQEADSLLEQLRVAQDDANTAQTEVRSARHEIQALKDAAKSFEDQALVDKSSDKEAYNLEINSLQQELDRLQREHDTIVSVQSNEINALRAALAIADENLSFERAKNESALQEMDALERNAAVELKKLKKNVDSLSNEKHMLESMAAEMKNKANVEIERLQKINQSQRRAAIKKVNALKEEMRQLSEARAVIASPLGVSLSAVDVKNPSNAGCEPYTPTHVADSASSTTYSSNPFGCSDKAEYISFKPDSTLDGIPYTMLEDVVEVYRSFNKIQAAPFGKQVQGCDGFVCLVKNKDLNQSLLVYVVWLMKETGEIIVCRPDHVSGSGDSTLNMVREGIGYFERVGFIMDELVLMSEPKQRQQQIDSLSFFHKTDIECAA